MRGELDIFGKFIFAFHDIGHDFPAVKKHDALFHPVHELARVGGENDRGAHFVNLPQDFQNLLGVELVEVAGARASDHGNKLPLPDFKIQVMDGGDAVWICSGYVLKADHKFSKYFSTKSSKFPSSTPAVSDVSNPVL